MKILYVDDEPINLKLFEINFSKYFEVITAINGHEGLKLLEQHQNINVVISDMKMPEMNGIEFIERANSHYPDIKYYILTGFEINKEILSAMEQGLILKYFRKPFNMTDILDTLRSLPS